MIKRAVDKLKKRVVLQNIETRLETQEMRAHFKKQDMRDLNGKINRSCDEFIRMEKEDKLIPVPSNSFKL